MQIVQELCKRPGLNRTGFEMPTIFIPNPSGKVLWWLLSQWNCYVVHNDNDSGVCVLIIALLVINTIIYAKWHLRVNNDSIGDNSLLFWCCDQTWIILKARLVKRKLRVAIVVVIILISSSAFMVSTCFSICPISVLGQKLRQVTLVHERWQNAYCISFALGHNNRTVV